METSTPCIFQNEMQYVQEMKTEVEIRGSSVCMNVQCGVRHTYVDMRRTWIVQLREGISLSYVYPSSFQFVTVRDLEKNTQIKRIFKNIMA
jgi:hypothetical protein